MRFRQPTRYKSIEFSMAPFKLQKPSNRELLGGGLLAQALRHLGTDVAFGLHGGHLDAFLVGAHEVGIRLIDTRHETTAVQAAEGYAKISGKVGVCFVTANSGCADIANDGLVRSNLSAASPMDFRALLPPLPTAPQFSVSLPVHPCKTAKRTPCKAFTTRWL